MRWRQQKRFPVIKAKPEYVFYSGDLEAVQSIGMRPENPVHTAGDMPTIETPYIVFIDITTAAICVFSIDGISTC